MKEFKGFSDQETFTQVPDSFFHHLLNEIEDAAELKVTVYVLWRIAHMESRSRSLCRSEILADQIFMAGMDIAQLDAGLEKAVDRGSLLRVENEEGGFYFLNSPRGRAAAEALEKGDWRSAARSESNPPPERPNIFRLYETNIGPLTPMLADALKDAEKTYSADEIEAAFSKAVKNNKRYWKYVEAILRNRKEVKDAKEQTGRDTEEDRRKYFEGKYSDFVEH
jgi:DnaD/phage-associated family protein